MMPDFLYRLFRPGNAKSQKGLPGENSQTGDAPHELDTLVPIILPPVLLETPWPGPIARLGDLPFAVAWAHMPQPNSFVYVNAETQTNWEAAKIDWRATAMTNLRRIAERYPTSTEWPDEDGKAFAYGLLTKDAIGPSRLLVPDMFESSFGDDYLVAIPERTCAIVYRSTLTDQQRETVDTVINGCFEKGTEPMSVERFRPERFWVL